MTNTFRSVQINGTYYLYVLKPWEREISITDELLKLDHPAWVRRDGETMQIHCSNGDATYDILPQSENYRRIQVRRGRLVESIFIAPPNNPDLKEGDG